LMYNGSVDWTAPIPAPAKNLAPIQPALLRTRDSAITA
jgi:hypothetical protein